MTPLSGLVTNLAPTATAQDVSLTQDVPTAITLAGTDPESASLTYFVATNPTHGVLSGTAPNLTYTPTAAYVGADSFTFRVADGTQYSTAATVSITVNSSAFSPASITGITAFWDFNDLTTITLNSNKITQITDAIGGFTMAQSSDAIRPLSVTAGGFNNRNYATFNGAGQYLYRTTPFALFGANQMSIAVRVKAAVGQTNKMLFARGNTSVNPDWVFATGNTNNAKLRFGINDLVVLSFIESNLTAYDNTWKTLVGTWDGVTQKMYVNSATADATSATPSITLGSTNAAFIGARYNGTYPENYGQGSIEYIATFNHALTTDDVTKLIAYGS